VLALQQAVKVHGISNITGGGFYENIPRMLPDGLMARVERKTVKVLPVFDYIQKMSDGKIDDHDMFNTFNMGVGLVVAVDPSEVDIAIATLKASGEDAYVIGEVTHGTEGVKIC
jgi:phosphoribosylformylglycinamidine cyclo-ligase